jgi:formylglycine-generating enzyme required for sulfatase activity
MRQRITIALGLVLMLAVSAVASQAASRMRIHRGAAIEDVYLAVVDSLTFDDPAPGMVWIPAGGFIMGSPTGEPGRMFYETQHLVTLTKELYVAPYEVTQSEWQAVMGWNESYYLGPNHPVETVTWYDAASYCNQRSVLEGLTPVYLIEGATYDGVHIASAAVSWNQEANGYRLLTEAEWEYACRATSMTAFCNGPITYTICSPVDPSLDLVGWYCGNTPSTTHDVGGKAANAWGLKDMHGNVYEWCWDWWDWQDYPGGAMQDPIGPPAGSRRCIRGGGWGYGPASCRSAHRSNDVPNYRGYSVGLRVARTVL